MYKQLLKTSALSGMGTLTKILTSMLSLKIVALYTGAVGVGILGQFMAVVNVIAVIAGGGITLGVIKFVAEYSSSPPKLSEFISSAFCYVLFFSLITLIIGLVFHESISQWVLGTTEYSYLFQCLAIVQFFIAVNLFLCAIINGFEKIKSLVFINMLSSILSMALVVYCSIFYQLQGTLLAFIVSQGIAAVIALSYVYREQWFGFIFALNVKFKYIARLSQYSLMNIVSALTVPMAQIIVRNDLNDLFGWGEVGYWQAVVRLSDSYLLFVTTALTAYYLPRLSQIQTNKELKLEMLQCYKYLMPILACILVFLYIFRAPIIYLLYNDSFAASEELFLYQLVGDFFRIGGWLFTYLLLAKSCTKTYIFTEIVLSLLFIIISHYFARIFGLVGITYSFALTYFLYWILMFSVAINYFKREKIIWPVAPTP